MHVQHSTTTFILCVSVLLRRFYVHNTVMDYAPDLIFAVCLNLSAKAEEEWSCAVGQASAVSQSISAHTQLDPTIVMKAEMLVLDGIRFNLRVFHPFRPLTGLLETLTRLDSEVQGSIPGVASKSAQVRDIIDWKRLREEAQSYLLTLLVSDAPLLFPPSQLALAALLYVADSETVGARLKWLTIQLLQLECSIERDAVENSTARSMSSSSDILEPKITCMFEEVLPAVHALFQAQHPSSEVIRHIQDKLVRSKNPLPPYEAEQQRAEAVEAARWTQQQELFNRRELSLLTDSGAGVPREPSLVEDGETGTQRNDRKRSIDALGESWEKAHYGEARFPGESGDSASRVTRKALSFD